MDNPNVILDEDDSTSLDQEEAERIRLRPYNGYDGWRTETPSMTDFPRVSSQVPLSPKVYNSDDMFGYELEVENDEEDDDFDDLDLDEDDDDDDDDEDDEDAEAAARGHHPIKRLPSIGRSTGSKKRKQQKGKRGSKKLKDRGTWQGKFDFILSLIGYSVGLGNVWRFPYLVYANGGGAFLIPFIVMMCVVGFPLLFMELAFGQYASLSPVCIFHRFSPLFAGIGYGMIAVSAIVMLYYNMIIAWTLYYMYASLTSELPWTRCDPEWSSPLCYSYKDKDDCLAADPNATYYNRTCYDAENATRLNITWLAHHCEKKAPADEYFNNYVLGNLWSIDETGNIQWHLLLSLLAAWVMVFLCLIKGVQSSGKVVYFTALFPYVVLVILFVRGITLPGAMEGILFYVKPDWSHLFVVKVWGDAAVQVFFALSPAWGGLITLASYNKFTNNCYRDSILVLLANAGTSIFSGFVVFSIIGYLAHELELPVTDVVDQGVGLAFMVYPEVVARLPISPLWSFLFFFMLITLGLDSQFALLETVQTAVLDRFPSLRDHKFLILLLVSTAGYAGGIIFTTQSGILWLGLFDQYAANFSVSIIAITECLLISWYYGTERFIRDIEKMIGVRSERWRWMWTWIWKLVTPSTLIFILFFNWIKHEPARSGDYLYPRWANIFGWVLAFIPTAIIVVVMIHTYVTYKGASNQSFIQKLHALMQPSESWGPTHRNIERMQRKSITSNNNNNQPGSTNSSQYRKGSSTRSHTQKANGQQSTNQSNNPNVSQTANGGSNPGQPNSQRNGQVPQKSRPNNQINGGLPNSKRGPTGPIMMINLNSTKNHQTSSTTSNGSNCSSSSELTTVTPTNLSQQSNSILTGIGSMGPLTSIVIDEVITSAEPANGMNRGGSSQIPGLPPPPAPGQKKKLPSTSSTGSSRKSFDNPTYDKNQSPEPESKSRNSRATSPGNNNIQRKPSYSDKNRETKI